MTIFAYATKPALFFLCAVLLLPLTGCRRKPPVLDGILAEAARELQGGDAAAARATLEEALAANPDSLTAHANLGLVCLQTGDLTAAVSALNRATEIAPGQPEVWELLARVLIRAGNAEGAAEVLANVSKPSETTFALKALAARQSGNPDAALLYLEKALKINRYYAPALFNIAVLQRDHFDAPVEALAAYRRFRETDPRNPRAAVSDDDFLKSARPAPAVAAPREIERSAPPAIAPIVADSPAVTVPKVAAVTVPASPAVQKPTPATVPAAVPSPVAALIRRADAEAAAGNSDTALIILKNAVQNHPENPDAIWALAMFYEKHPDLKIRADGLFATFMRMFPDDPRAKSRKATVAPVARGERQAVTSEGFFRKGLEHYNRQEWDAAITAYRQALSLDPKSSSCAYNLGLAYKARNDLDAAAAAFRHALNIEPDMIKSLYMLGLTEIHRQRNADALPHLNRLIAVHPDFAKAHYLLGTVYQAEKRPDAAAFHFERFLKLEPGDSAAPQVRRWLAQNQNRR